MDLKDKTEAPGTVLKKVSASDFPPVPFQVKYGFKTQRMSMPPTLSRQDIRSITHEMRDWSPKRLEMVAKVRQALCHKSDLSAAWLVKNHDWDGLVFAAEVTANTEFYSPRRGARISYFLSALGAWKVAHMAGAVAIRCLVARARYLKKLLAEPVIRLLEVVASRVAQGPRDAKKYIAEGAMRVETTMVQLLAAIVSSAKNCSPGTPLARFIAENKLAHLVELPEI